MSYRPLNVEEGRLIARFLSQGCTCRGGLNQDQACISA